MTRRGWSHWCAVELIGSALATENGFKFYPYGAMIVDAFTEAWAFAPQPATTTLNTPAQTPS